MSKTVVIHQPDFLPYLGFFHRFLNADLYIALDHAQFVIGGSACWTHRDKIKTAKGESWLSVSVRKPSHGTAINAVELAQVPDWRRNNLRLLQDNYRRSPHFHDIMPAIEALYASPCSRLSEFNLKSIEMLMDMFDVRLPIVLSSTLSPRGAKNEMLVDLLEKTGATRYLSGVGARAYFDPAPFAAAGIAVVWQSFSHPLYPQLHGEFIPYLSSIDALFNCGIAACRSLLRGA